MEDEVVVPDRSLAVPRSESKLMTREKRSSAEVGGESEVGRKRVKIRDLDSVIRSEEMVGASHHCSSTEKEKPQGFSKDAAPTNSESAQAEITGRDIPSALADPARTSIDLDNKVSLAISSASSDKLAGTDKSLSSGTHGIEHDATCAVSRGFCLDLNAEGVSSSLNQDPFYPYKNQEQLRASDASECGSTTGTRQEKDPMRIWKEMKQNGFLSSSYGGISVAKQRGRKSRSDGDKKRLELARREQTDRFARIAAPSGLLNELNPGIINHVRNRKQVHSIIEALVRSEKHENHHAGGKQATSAKTGGKEITGKKKDVENVSGLGMNPVDISHEDSRSTLSVSQQTRGWPMSMTESCHFNVDHLRRDDGLINVGRTFGKIHGTSHPTHDSKDDTLALKLSSSTTTASQNASTLSNEDSAEPTSFSSLSVNAANVAYHWLELIHQDIKGRLTALRRSKKRVRSVIHTELPFLMSREFSFNQQSDCYVMKNASAGCSDIATVNLHRARWTAVFGQMDKALSEEEKHLESRLKQVKEMQLHCEKGLVHFHVGAFHGSQQLGRLENDLRLEEEDNSERELAVRAAAASIYSTCNFLVSKENLPCS
ncbi:uncharacterized protein LOC127794369 isoform X2 [Diospyros lotus]|uniref:uncharacterized protein LOC127794369 isoform X2 n=1 Tax=Diospyros lotus TaxID=55363 RepID=UPI002253E068|nr:uncharacterized protein LOC127794369 isoform X2 [Diospyros lotus]